MVSKTTVVPRQRASKRQNSSQIFNLQVINRRFEYVSAFVYSKSHYGLFSVSEQLRSPLPWPHITPSLLSVDCLYTARGGLRAQFAQILTLIFDPLKQFLLEEKNAQSYTPPKKPNYCQTEQYSCENQVFILLRLPQNNTNNLSYIMLLNKLSRWKISKVASFFYYVQRNLTRSRTVKIFFSQDRTFESPIHKVKFPQNIWINDKWVPAPLLTQH